MRRIFREHTARAVVLLLCGVAAPPALGVAAIVVDHRSTDITTVPLAAIMQAKASLHIAYGHTSHGSQVTSGMTGLVAFANSGGLDLALPTDTFAWNHGGTGGALDLHDYAMGGDVGYYPQWVNNTRSYLGDPDPGTGRGTAHADVNVIIWSWCGQVSGKFASGVLAGEYLDPMAQLEQDYPGIAFIYMTGHVDHWDDSDNKAANQAIRDFCAANDKVLYDFADIESYDPDGTYFEFPSDNCDYYGSATGARLGNWATEWQTSHTEGVDWYNCSSAHSEPLNANRKAYAAWWLWARLAGWNGDPGGTAEPPVLELPSDQTGTEGDPVNLLVEASDANGDTLQFSAAGLPPGLSISPTTGRISGVLTLDSAGSYSVTLDVSDGTLRDAGVFAWEVVAAGDADGVSDWEESGPDGNLSDYDGDDDGTPDRLQDNATSLHTEAGDAYVTLCSPALTTLADVRAVANPSPDDAPANIGFPLGSFEFRVTGLTPGGSAQVVLFLPPCTTVDGYWKHGASVGGAPDHWYDFAYDSQTGAEILADRVILHLIDGGRGDEDLVADGAILDPGAPSLATLPPEPGDNGGAGTAGGGGGGGCFLETLRIQRAQSSNRYP